MEVGEFDDVDIVNVTPPPLSMYTQLMKLHQQMASNDPQKRKKYTNRVSLKKLFRYADRWDRLMIVVAILAAIGSGVMFPIFLLTMGDIIDDFGGSGTPTAHARLWTSPRPW